MTQNEPVFPQMYKIERVFVDTRKRKRRTSLEGAVRSALESYFIKCPKPNTQEITHISDDLGLERDVSAGGRTHTRAHTRTHSDVILVFTCPF